MHKVHVTHNSYSFSSKQLSNMIKLPSLPEIKSSKTTKAALPKLKVPPLGHAKTLNNLDASIADAIFEEDSITGTTAESFAPLPGTTEGHKRYMTMSLRSMTSFDLAEENHLRKNKIENILKELLSFDVDSVLFKPEEFDGIYSMEAKRRKKLEGQKKVFRLFEQILCLYELKFQIVSESYTDSFLGVEAIEDNFALIDYIQILAPIICKFPYSFFRRVNFPVISFCEDYYLQKTNVNFGESRMMMKGFFPIKRFDSADRIIDHFMMILYVNLKASVTNFEARVQKVVQDTSQYGVVKSLTELAGTRLVIKKTAASEREWRILKALIMNPKHALYHDNEIFQQKAMLFRSFLEEVDREGIDYRWWIKLENNELPSMKF